MLVLLTLRSFRINISTLGPLKVIYATVLFIILGATFSEGMFGTNKKFAFRGQQASKEDCLMERPCDSFMQTSFKG